MSQCSQRTGVLKQRACEGHRWKKPRIERQGESIKLSSPSGSYQHLLSTAVALLWIKFLDFPQVLRWF
jgi:hypothetical protein